MVLFPQDIFDRSYFFTREIGFKVRLRGFFTSEQITFNLHWISFYSGSKRGVIYPFSVEFINFHSSLFKNFKIFAQFLECIIIQNQSKNIILLGRLSKIIILCTKLNFFPPATHVLIKNMHTGLKMVCVTLSWGQKP